MLTATILAVSMQFFTITHHDPQFDLAQGLSETGVTYQLDSHYEVGDTVLVLYNNDDIVYEKKFDLLSKGVK